MAEVRNANSNHIKKKLKQFLPASNHEFSLFGARTDLSIDVHSEESTSTVKN